MTLSRLIISFCFVTLLCCSLNAQKSRPWDASWRAANENRINQLKNDSLRFLLPDSDFAAPLFDINGITHDLADILEANRGSVIVATLWFSSCPPCLKSLPIVRDMERRMQGKSVIFLYLNAFEAIEDWRHYSKSRILIDTKHNLRFVNLEKSAVKQTLAINGAPRYLLFDTQGRLCEPYAPVPGKGLESHIWRMIEDY